MIFISRNRYARITQHLIFWAVSFLVLSLYFKTGNKITQVDLIYTLWFHLSLLGVVYMNTAFLIPVFLSGKKDLVYAFLFCVNIFLFAALNHFLFSYLIDFISPGYYFISYYNYADLLLFHFIYASLATLLKLSKAWFSLMDTKNKINALEKEKKITELQALKAQVNPHFMFNSLNNIYALSLKKSSRTPEMILLLSGLLRYIIYEATVDYVPLKNELKVIEDYIQLQRIRSDEQLNIGYTVEGDSGEKEIAPLLFLPLVENIFKHGIKASVGSPSASIRIKIEGKILTAEMRNTMDKDQKKEETKGIGLVNLRKRLQLIYPEQHEMRIQNDNQEYFLFLKINNLKDA